MYSDLRRFRTFRRRLGSIGVCVVVVVWMWLILPTQDRMLATNGEQSGNKTVVFKLHYQFARCRSCLMCKIT